MIEGSKNESSANEVTEQFQKALERLKNLINNTDIKNVKENYLTRFLYGTNCSEDESFRKIMSFYDHLKQYPDWYCKEGPTKFKSIIDKDVRAILPDCDKEGRPIYLAKNGNIDPNTMSMLDLVAVDDIWIESLLNKHPNLAAKGLCVIMDIKDQNWKLTKWMVPSHIKQSMKKIDNLPFRDFRIHVVNNSWWINVAIKIVWPFMPQKLKEMIKFHFDDLESIYEYIDKKFLPIEYGGLKEIKYEELYENLYKENDEIFKSFDAYRNVQKNNK